MIEMIEMIELTEREKEKFSQYCEEQAIRRFNLAIGMGASKNFPRKQIIDQINDVEAYERVCSDLRIPF